MQIYFLGALFFVSLKVFAIESSEGLQPCMQIKKACESAGFQKGKAKDGKISVKDCMQKITNGETVTHVKLSSDIINGCKEKHEK